jgi:tRNA modification GTPase
VNDFEQQQIQYLLVGNKVDTANNAVEKFTTFKNIIFISAKDNSNIEVLRNALIIAATDGNINTEATIVTNARHYDALQKLFVAIQDVQAGLQQHIQSDLLALDIRQALHYLGEITGEITNEDQLDFIFSKFCIGK